MLKLYKRVLKYNLINIISSIVLAIVQVLNLTIWSSWYILLLDDKVVILIFFWPILLLVAIITANRRSLRKFIHNENKEMYATNNVNIDNEIDTGSLSEEAWEALPVSSISYCTYVQNADVIFHGELNDIGIKYIIDTFSYKILYKLDDSTHTVAEITGEALTINTTNINFGSEWIVYVSENIAIEEREPRQDYEIQIGSGELFYNSGTDEKDLEKVKSIITKNHKFFGKKSSVVVLFHEGSLIYIDTNDSKFKIKLAFIISKSKLDKTIINQKAQVYRFNQFLVEISRMLNE